MPDFKNSATVQDPALNKAFQEGAARTDDQDVLNHDNWIYTVWFCFDGVAIRLKKYGPAMWDTLMREMTEHLSNGPGTSVQVVSTMRGDEPVEQPKSLAKDEDIVDAEIVSND